VIKRFTVAAIPRIPRPSQHGEDPVAHRQDGAGPRARSSRWPVPARWRHSRSRCVTTRSGSSA